VCLDDAGDQVPVANPHTRRKCASSVASRNRCKITCLAVMVAMRPKSPGGVVEFALHLTVGVEVGSEHRDRAGLTVDLDPGVRMCAFGVPVSRQQRGFRSRR